MSFVTPDRPQTAPEASKPAHDALSLGDALNNARKALVVAAIEADLCGDLALSAALYEESRQMGLRIPGAWSKTA